MKQEGNLIKTDLLDEGLFVHNRDLILLYDIISHYPDDYTNYKTKFADNILNIIQKVVDKKNEILEKEYRMHNEKYKEE